MNLSYEGITKLGKMRNALRLCVHVVRRKERELLLQNDISLSLVLVNYDTYGLTCVARILFTFLVYI